LQADVIEWLSEHMRRVHYVNGLQENLQGQQPASEEVRTEVKALVEQCRVALRIAPKRTTRPSLYLIHVRLGSRKTSIRGRACSRP
jgi:hypothetical protein